MLPTWLKGGSRRLLHWLLPVLFCPVAAAEWPASIACLGDSITRAALADGSIQGLAMGQPEHAWTTGTAPEDGVLSHYERILSETPEIEEQQWNLAVSGSTADDLPAQAVAAVLTGADYVLIQIGGNDVCADTLDEMTPAAEFEQHMDNTLMTLQLGLPDATILVTDAVRVRRLYGLGKSNFGCLVKWWLFRWCDNVLRQGIAARLAADVRNIEYNGALRRRCAERGIAFSEVVFDLEWRLEDLSRVDCFHLSLQGQQRLAEATFNAKLFSPAEEARSEQ